MLYIGAPKTKFLNISQDSQLSQASFWGLNYSSCRQSRGTRSLSSLGTKIGQALCVLVLVNPRACMRLAGKNKKKTKLTMHEKVHLFSTTDAVVVATRG